MEHTHYDEADVSAVTQFAEQVQNPMRADESIFAATQLNYVKARVYNAPQLPMGALALVPQESDAPEWAETITYRSFSEVGMAKIIANYADDLPRADVAGTETTVRVKTIGDSYGYNISELRASIALGQNLPTRKANAARRAIEIKMNQIAMIGDAAYGLYGLTNHPNIGETTGTGITGAWGTTATADQILATLDTLYGAVRTQSNGIHTPNRMALPSSAYGALFSKRLGDTGGLTVGQFFMNKHPGFQFVEMPELQTAGDGGVSLAIIGEFDAQNLALETVMPFNQLPAQARNLELVVPCYARTGGVSVHYPLAFTKVEGL